MEFSLCSNRITAVKINNSKGFWLYHNPNWTITTSGNGLRSEIYSELQESFFFRKLLVLEESLFNSTTENE